MGDTAGIEARIERVRRLASDRTNSPRLYEAASIAQSILYDTAGGGNPSMHALEEAVKSREWSKLWGACRAVLALYDDGVLPDPDLRIAHEIEGSLLDIAESQAKAAEDAGNAPSKQLALGIASFLAGAALEDALRRRCDASAVAYHAQRSSIAKLQAALYLPSNQVECITQSENKQITAWGDTRNKADHGKFSEITQTEVVAMILGARGFIDKYFP